MDYTAAIAEITAVPTDAGPVLLAVLGVVVAFYAFRKIKGNIK